MAKGNIKTKGHLAGTNPQEDIDKLKRTLIPTKMQGSPFKLGSNRGNNSYSGFQAKGLITPIQNKEGEKEKKTDNLQDNYQNYTEQDMKEGKIRAGKAAAIAAAKAGKTKFKYGGSSYTIPQDILAQYSK